MKPPICCICHHDFRHSIQEGGLVSFKLSEKDKEYNQRFKEKGFVGHKAGTAWFCKDHYKLAKKYQNLTLSEAKLKIKKKTNIELFSVIKVIFLLWFLFMAISGLINFFDSLKVRYNREYSFFAIWYTLYTTSFFRPFLFFIIPFIGYFLKNKLGWVLLTSYFYFLFVNIFFQLRASELQDFYFMLKTVLVLIFIFSLIFIMNLKKIRFKHYGITKFLISINTLSCLLGLCLSLVLFYLKDN